MTWLLIIYLNSFHSQSIATEKFEDEATCLMAGFEVVKFSKTAGEESHIATKCVQI